MIGLDKGGTSVQAFVSSDFSCSYRLQQHTLTPSNSHAGLLAPDHDIRTTASYCALPSTQIDNMSNGMLLRCHTVLDVFVSSYLLIAMPDYI